ncbi:YadA-like family protein [Paraburkholderia sabiae]|uniref:YadA-like family protein n=1 Tax=Paraburkholderia sabiae TaxID=273251 RepID=A0ABU9QGR8_9BURK
MALSAGSYSGVALASNGTITLCGSSGWSHGWAGETYNLNGCGSGYNFYLGSNANAYGAGGTGGVASVSDNQSNQLILQGPNGVLISGTEYLQGNKITTLAAGTISSGSSDGVNGSQLYATNQNVSNLANVVNNLNNNGSSGGNLKYFHATSALADSTAGGAESVAIGGAATAATSNSVALGSNSVASSTTLTTAGYNPGGAAISALSAAGEVSVGKAGSERRITNVASGYAATDAVNVSQLMSEDAKVNAEGASTAAAFGGGASYNPTTGAITNPTYNIGGATYNNVAGALTNLDARVNNLSNGSGSATSLKYFNATSALADSSAGGSESVAIGGAANASASNAVALGSNSVADRANSVSVGSSTAQRQITNLAAGTAATDAVDVAQLSGVAAAIGGGASVKADGSIAQPTFNVYGNTYSNVGDALSNISAATGNIVQNLKYIKFGVSTAAAAQAGGTDSLAIGGNSFANANGSVAIGAGARALAQNSVAIGYGSATSIANAFAVGSATSTRRIVNVADGQVDTDAATVGQVNSDIQAAIANLNLSSTQAQPKLLTSAVHSAQLLGATSSLTPAQLIMSGVTDKAGQIDAEGSDALAIGLNSQAMADNAVAIGGTVRVGSAAAVGIGQNIAVNGVNTVVMGSMVSASGDNAIVFGNNGTEADADNAIAIGNNVQVGGSNTIGIGKDIIASGSNSVSLGYASADGGRANVLSVGNGTLQRQIINVAAGTKQTDAVNVSQLTGVTTALGGGATVSPTTGAIVAPAYNVAGNTFNNVGAALTALDAGEKAINNNVMNVTNVVNNITVGGGIKYFHANSSLADSSAKGTDSVAIGGNAVANTSNSVALGANSVASAATLSSAAFAPGGFSISAATAAGEVSIGAQGAERRITNVAAGYSATDAVNVSQLMAEDQKVNGVSNNLSNLSNTVNNMAAGGGSMKYFHANSSLADSTASGLNAIGVGPQATAAGTNAIAIGYNASATAANSVALGSNSTTTANLSAAAYNPSSATLSGATAAGEVSVGYAGAERRVTNLAAGSAATDAVNVSQLMAEDSKVNAEGAATAAALGGGSSYNSSTGAITNPTYNVAGATYNNVAGALTGVDGRMNNLGNTITYMNNVINNTVINGGGIKYFHANSTLADSTASGTNSVAIGGGAIATASNSVALGANSTTTANLSAAAYNPGSATLSGTTAAGEVSVGYAGAERRVTNLAAGSAATDAVNVSQLMSEDSKVNAEGAATAAALGGGSSYNSSTGAITNPTYNVAGTTYNNVAGALTGVDGRMNNLGNTITYMNNVINNTVINGGGIKYFHANSTLADSTASGANSVAIGGAAIATASNSVALGANSTTTANLSAAAFNPGGTLSGTTAAGEVSVGSASVNRRITNLAAGAAPTDAVNVSQLMAEDAKVNNVGNNLSNLNNYVNNIANGGANMKYFNVSSSLAAASATGTDSVAAGPNAVATASGAVALGANSVADRANTVSVGSSTAQRQIVNVGAGTNQTDAVNVSQLSGVTAALGGGASVKADGSIAPPAYNMYGQTFSNVGDALASINNNTANIVQNLKYIRFGSSTSAAAQAAGTDSVAIGGNSFANAAGALAIGAGARAMAQNSVAVGYGSATSIANTFAVGSALSTRRIVNVADGQAATDAATVGQVTSDIQAAIANLNLSSTQAQPKLLATAVRSTQLLGASSSLTPDQMIMSGVTDKAGQIDAQGSDAMAIGLNSQAMADNAVAIGGSVRVGSAASVGIGQNIAINGTNTVVMGTMVSANANNGIVFGNNGTEADADDAIAIGNNVQVGGANTMAIGKDIVAGGTNSITLGYASSDGNRTNVLSVGSSKLQRQIINVAAGYSATDAVNVSQLTGAVNALGGGATINPTTGAVVAPAYSLAGTTYVNVGAALSSLDTRIASGGDALAVDYDTSAKDQITLKGASGTKITGLSAGGVNASSADAINGSQLYAQGASTAAALGGGASVNPTTGAITAPQYTFGGGTYTNVGDALTALNNAAGSGNALGVVYDGQDKSKITLAGANGTTITKLAAGGVNASSTDAVNGTQLYNVAASVSNAVGGGSTVNTDGTISNPTYVMNGGTSVTTIGGAISNLDNRVFANSTDITNLQTQINEGGIGLVTQDATTSNILVASKTGGSLVDFTGTAGARVLTGVSAGKVNGSSLDAVNGTQLYNVASSVSNAIGGGSTVKYDGTITNPTYNVGGTTVTTIGGAITNLDVRVAQNTTAITNLQTQINEGGIGLVTQDSKSKNILVASKTDGSVVDFTGSAGVRVLKGVADGVEANDAVNVGQLQAAGIISPTGNVKTAVTYDTDANGKTNYSSVTLGDGTPNAAPVLLQNVAAGSHATDAVNYSQYADLVAKVNNISNVGTGVDTLFVGDGDRNTEAAQAGGSHATAMGALSVANGAQSVATGYASNASGQNAVAMGANAKASGNNSVALGAGSVADQDNTVSVGSATQQRRITNVATGTATTDAVNVGQLNDAIAQANASVDDKVNQGVQSANSYTNQQVNNLSRKMDSLGAAAMAATSLIPNARAEGNFQMSAAAGTYGGAAAIAIGANYWVNDRVLVNAHVTRSTGYGANTGASVGATIGF